MYNKIYQMLMEEVDTNVDTIYNALKMLTRTNKHLTLTRYKGGVELSANESVYPYLKATLRFVPTNGKVQITSVNHDAVFANTWTNLYRKSWNIFLMKDNEIVPIVFYNYYPINVTTELDNNQLLELVDAFSNDIRDIDAKYNKSGKIKETVTEYCADIDEYDDADYSDKQRDLGTFKVQIERFGRGMVARWLKELKN